MMSVYGCRCHTNARGGPAAPRISALSASGSDLRTRRKREQRRAEHSVVLCRVESSRPRALPRTLSCGCHPICSKLNADDIAIGFSPGGHADARRIVHAHIVLRARKVSEDMLSRRALRITTRHTPDALAPRRDEFAAPHKAQGA